MPFIIISAELISTETKLPLCHGCVSGCRTGTSYGEDEKRGILVPAVGFGTFLTCSWTGHHFVPRQQKALSPGQWEFTNMGCLHAWSALCPAEHHPCGRELSVRMVPSTMAIWGPPAQPLSCVQGKEEAPGSTCMTLGRDAGRALLCCSPPSHQ